jgi:hypothetical protein
MPESVMSQALRPPPTGIELGPRMRDLQPSNFTSPSCGQPHASSHLGSAGYFRRLFRERLHCIQARSHTQWAPLETFPNSANAGHYGQERVSQTQETDQTANVENLCRCAEQPLLKRHAYTSSSIDLELTAACFAFFILSPYRADSQ